MPKLPEFEIEKIIRLLKEGKPLPDKHKEDLIQQLEQLKKSILFDTKKEYELTYADKEREVDMSEWYSQRSNEELSALKVFESSINQLANEFLGQRALNFYHEAELIAFLLGCLRSSNNISEYVNRTSVYLAHLEWPCLLKRRIDLVLWRPGTCKTAIDLWKGRSNCAKKLPLLAAVQVKRGPGRLTSWSSTEKDIKDLEKVDTFENFEKPVLYFLEWVDHGLQKHEHDHQTFNEIQHNLEEWCGKALNRRAFVISRDRIGFAYPKGAWLVDPLPLGLREIIS